MSLVLSSYGELKTAFTDYHNNDNPEVLARTETFIALAERKIYRKLRIAANEKVATYTPASDTDFITSITLPTDYLEAKMVLVDGLPVDRISEIQYFDALKQANGLGAGRGSAQGQPTSFARLGDKFAFYPSPDGAYTVQLYYWADLSGTLNADADTNEVLRSAPDLYLYGACLELQPFIKNDERVNLWSQMYRSAFETLESQRDEDEYSGSNNTVSAAGSGTYGT